MSDLRNKRAYEQILAQRAKNTIANEAGGKSFANLRAKGIPMDVANTNAADTLSDVVDKMKAKTNLSGVGKIVDDFDPRINANVRGGKLDLLNKAIHGAEDAAPKAAGLLGNSKGFAKLLPMLGLGGAALAASSIFNKARAGDIPGAAMETADQVTDHVPGIGNLKMAMESSPLGEGEDKELAALKQTQMAAQNPEERRFSKIRQLMGK